MIVLYSTHCPCTSVPSGQARDPLPQFKRHCLDAGLLAEAQIADIEKEVLAVVDEAVQFADESPKPVRSFY